MKKKDGITLIALIITIVVLVILAGVTIRTISGNGGIIGNANKIAGKYNNKAKEEEDILGTFENKLKEYAGENGEEPSIPDKPTPTNAEYFNWTTTETEATITGFSDVGKQKYNAGEITNLVIPSEYNGLPVTRIGKKAFFQCTGISSVTIPNSVTTIVGGAFYNCTGLTELFIPKTLTKVNYDTWGPFEECSNIEKVEFEEGTTKIPDYILNGARLKKGVEIIIPSTVTMIGKSAFYNCTGLTELFIPKTLTKVNYDTWGPFAKCSNIGKVEFEEGTMKIPDYILCEATLKSGVEIIIPSTVTMIGKNAFSGCKGITSINIPNNVTTIGDSAFYKCSNLTTVNFCGTEEKWNAISIGDYNEPLKSATKNFNQ